MKLIFKIRRFLSVLIIFGIISFVGAEAMLHHHNYKTNDTHLVLNAEPHSSNSNTCLLCEMLKNLQTYSTIIPIFSLKFIVFHTNQILLKDNLVSTNIDLLIGRSPPSKI